MDEYATVNKQISVIEEKPEEYLEDNESQEENEFIPKDMEFNSINQLYDECLSYLKQENVNGIAEPIEPDYVSIEDYSEHNDNTNNENTEDNDHRSNDNQINDVKVFEEHDSKSNGLDDNENKMIYKIENELISNESIDTVKSEPRSERLRRLSQQLPKIIITQTQSNTSLNIRRHEDNITDYGFKRNNIKKLEHKSLPKINPKYKEYEFKRNYLMDRTDQVRRMDEKKLIGNGKKQPITKDSSSKPPAPRRPGQPDFCKRLVSKRGIENVAVISNVPFERIRLLNDTFHTLINLRWRWIVSGTIVVHFAIWLVFAVFWYIAARAHYDFEPDPPPRTCVTGGHDFLTIFLASVEAQTTIGFGDRAIDEECPESIFLFIMQLILGTGLSGVLTCVVYAKLTRPEKLSRDGVGFSKKAVISLRDGQLCLMLRAWDLNYDHIISSQFTAHFVHTHRTKEDEVIRYYAQTLALRQRQFLLWPVTLLHVIDHSSPLYGYTPEMVNNTNYEITVSLKGASASMGTFTQSQTSYLPREVLWGHRFPSVVKYDSRKQKYVIDHAKLDSTEPVDTPLCSARQLASGSTTTTSTAEKVTLTPCPGTPSSFSDRISSFHLERSSSFRKNNNAS